MIRASRIAPLVDAGAAAFSIYLSYWLRFDPGVLVEFLSSAHRSAPAAALLVPLTCAVAGLYRRPIPRLWAIRLMVGVAAGWALTAIVIWSMFGFDRVSRFSFMAAALLTILAAGGWRAFEAVGDLRRQSRQTGAQFDDRGPGGVSVGVGLMQLFKYRELLRNLVWKDLKLKYRGSALGFVWSLANPLLMLLVYTLAFTYILGIRKDAFVYFLLVGLLPWTFFASTTSMATAAIVESGGLLRSVRFPRTVMPLATVLFNLTQYLLTFAVLLPVMLVLFNRPVTSSMLAFPGVLVLLLLFTTGVALMVSAATVFFRDLKHLIEIGLAIMFWMTPILYDLNDVPEWLRLPILLSPMSSFVSALHEAFYGRVWPDVGLWFAALAWSLTTFVAGVSLFLTLEDRFAEHV